MGIGVAFVVEIGLLLQIRDLLCGAAGAVVSQKQPCAQGHNFNSGEGAADEIRVSEAGPSPYAGQPVAAGAADEATCPSGLEKETRVRAMGAQHVAPNRPLPSRTVCKRVGEQLASPRKKKANVGVLLHMCCGYCVRAADVAVCVCLGACDVVLLLTEGLLVAGACADTIGAGAAPAEKSGVPYEIDLTGGDSSDMRGLEDDVDDNVLASTKRNNVVLSSDDEEFACPEQGEGCLAKRHGLGSAGECAVRGAGGGFRLPIVHRSLCSRDARL